jgi:Cysteine-rich secretory protein family
MAALRRPSPRRVRPEIEALEDRWLPARLITLNPLTHAVTVQGTPQTDRLIVTARGGWVTVQLSGGARQWKEFARRRVTEVFFYPNGGADQLINRTAISSVRLDFTPAPGQPELAPPLNALRQSRGLAPLTVNPLLQQAAQAHADNMARKDRYGDTDTNGHILDGHDYIYRAAAVGYRGSQLGEIVAYNVGYADPLLRLVVQWQGSPTHLAQILNAGYTEAGFGLARGASGRTYGVVLFGRPA